jgi:hypothetical protein
MVRAAGIDCCQDRYVIENGTVQHSGGERTIRLATNPFKDRHTRLDESVQTLFNRACTARAFGERVVSANTEIVPGLVQGGVWYLGEHLIRFGIGIDIDNVNLLKQVFEKPRRQNPDSSSARY